MRNFGWTRNNRRKKRKDKISVPNAANLPNPPELVDFDTDNSHNIYGLLHCDRDQIEIPNPPDLAVAPPEQPGQPIKRVPVLPIHVRPGIPVTLRPDPKPPKPEIPTSGVPVEYSAKRQPEIAEEQPGLGTEVKSTIVSDGLRIEYIPKTTLPVNVRPQHNIDISPIPIPGEFVVVQVSGTDTGDPVSPAKSAPADVDFRIIPVDVFIEAVSNAEKVVFVQESDTSGTDVGIALCFPPIEEISVPIEIISGTELNPVFCKDALVMHTEDTSSGTTLFPVICGDAAHILSVLFEKFSWKHIAAMNLEFEWEGSGGSVETLQFKNLEGLQSIRWVESEDLTETEENITFSEDGSSNNQIGWNKGT